MVQNFSFTDFLHEACDAFYLEFNRDNLIRMSECIRSEFGEDTLAQAMANKVRKKEEIFLLLVMLDDWLM
jgi:hypothetical protein